MPDETPPALTIGAFALASRLSVKALRVYEHHGLLAPHTVDEHTGYRYYHPDQLVPARLIARLRELAMPLDRIGSVLTARDHAEADRHLAFWWAGQERVAELRRGLVRSLRDELDPQRSSPLDVEDPAWPVSYVFTPDWRLVSEHRNVSVDELPDLIADTIQRLAQVTMVAPGTEANPVIVIYHGRVNLDSDGPVEVCLALDPCADVDVDRVPPGTYMRRQKPQREARVTLTKKQLVYPDILAAYNHLERRIAADGHAPSGPPREYYVHDIHAAEPDHPVGQAAIPLIANTT